MSVTTWTRIEPDVIRNQSALDLADGVAARLADPLWMLGRQWQMGELTGEDAGSPVSVHATASSFLIDTIFTPSGEKTYNAVSVAAEAEVERDGAAADLRTRAAGGFSFVDRLNEDRLTSYTATVLKRFALDPLSGYAKASDGDLLLAAADNGTLAATLGVKDADKSAFAAVVSAWVAWYRPRGGKRPAGAFLPDRFEYNFALGATVEEGRLSLDASDHPGGRLDWYSFSTQAPASAANSSAKTTETTTVPLLLEIPGMPGLWFWELEDPRFDTGRIETGPSDTGRLLLIESALAYASDWFLFPLRLPVASLSRITSFQVTDTFGVTTNIRPAEEVRPHADWKLWRLTGSETVPYLLLPPPSAGFSASEAVEDVVLARDEGANLAWALPLQFSDVHGRPVRVSPEQVDLSVQPAADTDLAYVPLSPLPDARVPLVLVESENERYLVRGSLANSEGQSANPGVLIGNDFRLRDEELIDDGMRLQRQFELGRTPDGVLHLWASRIKQPGARLMASGLQFDRIVPRQP